jgi:tetratricopeptide (TPR) repeat protein
MWGAGTVGLHVTNVALHVLNVVLLVALLGGGPKGDPKAAAFAGALFATHPLMSQGVAYVSGRADLLAATCALATLLAFRRWVTAAGVRRLVWVILFLGLTAASDGVIAIAVPVLLLLTDRLLLRDESVVPDREPDRIRRRLLFFHGYLIVVAALCWLIRAAVLIRLGDVAPLGNVLTQLASLGRFVRLLVLPVGQAITHALPRPGLADPAVLGSVVVVLVLATVAWTSRERSPWVAFGLAWIGVCLAPRLLFPQREPFAEHHLYLPSGGAFVAVAAACVTQAWRLPARVGPALAVVVSLGLAAVTLWRVHVWSDPVALWTAAIDDGPRLDSWRSNRRLIAIQFAGRGFERLKAGDEQGALEDYDRAVKVDDAFAAAYLRRGEVRLRKRDLYGARSDWVRVIELRPGSALAYALRGGVRARQGDLEGASEDLDRALALDPNLAQAYDGRGSVRLERGDFEGAMADYQRALELEPRLAQAWANRGLALLRAGKIKRAATDLERAVELGHVAAALGLADAREQLGDTKGALRSYQRAVEVSPNDPEAHGNLGVAFAQRGLTERAIECYERALRIRPDDARVHYNLGVAYTTRGALDHAIHSYDLAISYDPDMARAYTNRGRLYAQKEDVELAMADLTQAVERDPKDVVAWVNRAQLRARGKNFEGAIADCGAAIEADPTYVYAWRNRGRAREALGRHGQALGDYSEALRLVDRRDAKLVESLEQAVERCRRAKQ